MKLLSIDCPTPPALCRYRIDPSQRLRVEEYRGRIGLEELRSVAEAVVEDPSWSRQHHGLIDFSAAHLDLTANDVLRLALLLRQEDYRTDGWLVFAVGDSSSFGTIRMLGHWARNTDRSRIFRTREEAEAWLELNADHIPPGFGSGFTDAYQPTVRNAG